jgi:hypothetical protein
MAALMVVGSHATTLAGVTLYSSYLAAFLERA